MQEIAIRAYNICFDSHKDASGIGYPQCIYYYIFIVYIHCGDTKERNSLVARGISYIRSNETQ